MYILKLFRRISSLVLRSPPLRNVPSSCLAAGRRGVRTAVRPPVCNALLAARPDFTLNTGTNKLPPRTALCARRRGCRPWAGPAPSWEQRPCRGYYAYAVENDYKKDRYLSNRPLSPLVATDTAPLTQCDLLYTRKRIAHVELKRVVPERFLRLPTNSWIDRAGASVRGRRGKARS